MKEATRSLLSINFQAYHCNEFEGFDRKLQLGKQLMAQARRQNQMQNAERIKARTKATATETRSLAH